MPHMRWLRSLATLAALMLGLLMWTEDADARAERGSGLAGSAAFAALGFSRLVTLDNSLPAYAAQPTYPGGSLGDLFNRPGLIGGFAAGFLGAGALGLVFGHGMIGELSGFPSILGLLFQLALLSMLGRLIWSWWRADRAAAIADLSPRQLADAYGRSRNEVLPDIDAGHDRDTGQEAKKIRAGKK
jgi:hypothetical protein